MRRDLRAALLAGLLATAAGAEAMPADFDAVKPRLDAAHRAALERNSARWVQWTAAQRDAFRQREAAWNALPPAQRGERRERYRAWATLPPEERVRLDIAHREFAALPPATQQALRARFDMQDESTRRGWRLGPTLGAHYAALQPLVAQVPADERLPLLQALRRLDSAQRAQLATLAQRTPPAERDRLRRDLLATPADRVQDWLWARLDR